MLEEETLFLNGMAMNKEYMFCLKTGYIEFARLEFSTDAVHAVIFSLAVVMAAQVH